MSAPNWDEWMDEDLWTVAEAAALVLGLEPIEADPELEAHLNAISDPETRRKFEKVYKKTKRAIQAGKLTARQGLQPWFGNILVEPREFISWAVRRRLPVPPPLQSAVEVPPPELSESERSSLLKMLLGIAVAKYGYRPDEARNPASGTKSGSIKADVERLGLDITADTVRKYLDQATRLFGNSITIPD